MTRRPLNIAVLIPNSEGPSSEFRQGIARYAQTRPDWLLHQVRSPSLADLPDLGRRRFEGALASGHTPGDLQAYAAWDQPLVTCSWAPPEIGLVTVCADNREAGRMAAEHLLELGMRQFGYLGLPYALDDHLRWEGLREAVEAAGRTCSRLDLPWGWDPARRLERDERIAGWLAALGPPVGVLAFSDALGTWVVEGAAVGGLEVPDDVAVIGIDDADLTCHMCSPALSSVSTNGETVGFEAAAVLDGWLRGAAPPSEPVLIAPQGVIHRASTDVLAIEDAVVVRAVRFLRSHAHERIDVGDAVEHVRVSRRNLEQRFTAALGHTPAEELRRARVRRARQLLVDTDWQVASVAYESGFATVAHLSRTFKKYVGVAPSVYRRRRRSVGRQLDEDR
jgi:LacI family transcriptional regulator